MMYAPGPAFGAIRIVSLPGACSPLSLVVNVHCRIGRSCVLNLVKSGRPPSMRASSTTLTGVIVKVTSFTLRQVRLICCSDPGRNVDATITTTEGEVICATAVSAGP